MERQLLFSLADYGNYINYEENPGTVNEGQHIVNTGHVMLCGVTEENTDSLKMYALCLQTSALDSPPHVIEGVFDIQDDEKCLVRNATCSCKTGKSGRCKHISAVLIFCTRISLENLEKISQTEIANLWSTKNGDIQEKYRSVPIEEMPCFKNNCAEKIVMDDDCSRRIRSIMISALPSSALALNMTDRSQRAEKRPQRAANKFQEAAGTASNSK